MGAPSADPRVWPEGVALEPWVQEIDRACFGDAWGPPLDGERLWVIEGDAFARWSVITVAAEAELLRIGVRPEARRRGLGTALLEHCERDLARAGIRTLFLEVREHNEAARALYVARGWEEWGYRSKYYPDGEGAVLFRKELNRGTGNREQGI